MVAKVKGFIKRKINTRENRVKSLKAKIYDLIQENEKLKTRLKKYNKIINKISKLNREDKKKFYELIGENKDGK